MKALIATIVIVCVSLLAACVPSLHPIYTESDLTTESWIVGTWIEKDTYDTWTFTRLGKSGYSLIHADAGGRKGKYEARLVKLDDKLFLDIFPVKTASDNEIYADRFLPTHTFLHINHEGSTAYISYMEPRWLKEYLAANPEAISHEKVAGEIVLTSSPKETQRFILAHLKTSGAFSERSVLTRKRG